MNVVIDRDNCGNCQLCVEACPEVFDLHQGEVVALREDVPSELEVDCLFVRDACPVQAVEVLGSKGVCRDNGTCP